MTKKKFLENFFSNKLSKKSRWKIELILAGTKLFYKYNYLIVSAAFISMYIFIKLFWYLDTKKKFPSETNVIIPDDYIDFIAYLDFTQYFIPILLYAVFIIAIISFIAYIHLHVKDKRIILDPLILTTIYFISLYFTFQENSEAVTFLVLPMMMLFFYVYRNKLDWKVDNLGAIFFKSIIIIVISYFTVHFNHLTTTYQLFQESTNRYIESNVNYYISSKSDDIVNTVKNISKAKKEKIKKLVKKELQSYKYNVETRTKKLNQKLKKIEKKYGIKFEGNYTSKNLIYK